MPRPRVHDLDQVLDTAEQLVAEQGPENLTVRNLAAAAGVSNGAIYHGFGSLRSLLGHVWLRAATDFLQLQTELVDNALEQAPPASDASTSAVVAAADAPAAFAAERPDAARMLLTVRREQLLGPELPADIADALFNLDRQLVALLIRLSQLMWDRSDGAAVDVITTCVVDLPTALYRREITSAPASTAAITPDTRTRLAAAVRAVLTVRPPERHRKSITHSRKD